LRGDVHRRTILLFSQGSDRGAPDERPVFDLAVTVYGCECQRKRVSGREHQQELSLLPKLVVLDLLGREEGEEMLNLRMWYKIGLGLIIAVAAVAPRAHAGTIVDVNSGLYMAPTESNNITGSDVILLDVAPAWAPNGQNADGMPYLWVSYADTGSNCTNLGTCPPNTTVPPDGSMGSPTAIFKQTFDLPFASNAGSISFWADDTAAVYVDGVEWIPPSGVLGPACTASGIGCMADHDVTLNFGVGSGLVDLGAGSHTIQIDAYQLWGGPFGVMYGGEITSSATTTPEPSTYLLGGLGAIALLIASRRVRKPS
jgi:PEP-CTERM motif